MTKMNNTSCSVQKHAAASLLAEQQLLLPSHWFIAASPQCAANRPRKRPARPQSLQDISTPLACCTAQSSTPAAAGPCQESAAHCPAPAAGAPGLSGPCTSRSCPASTKDQQTHCYLRLAQTGSDRLRTGQQASSSSSTCSPFKRCCQTCSGGSCCI